MLRVQRTEPGTHALLGQLFLNNQLLCVTLEDAPGEGKGAIPPGIYRIVLTYSRRFQALLPELVAVPGFTGIRIHAGNRSADTEGCILVGRYQSGEAEIAESRVALGGLLTRWPEWHDDVIEVSTSA